MNNAQLSFSELVADLAGDFVTFPKDQFLSIWKTQTLSRRCSHPSPPRAHPSEEDMRETIDMFSIQVAKWVTVKQVLFRNQWDWEHVSFDDEIATCNDKSGREGGYWDEVHQPEQRHVQGPHSQAHSP